MEIDVANGGSTSSRSLAGHLFSGWTWRMAWRDSRTSRRRLLLFSCSIILGIAALAAIGSLGVNLNRAVEEQAKTLLGADLVISSRDAFDTNAEDLIRQIGGEQSREISFATMIYFPRTGGTRLVQARALSGGFPYYGQFETEPTNAAADFRRSGGGAMVEDTLLTQFDAKVGDQVKIGNLDSRVVGRLEKIPGEAVALSAIAPHVYFSMDDLAGTGLLGTGSLAQYRVYFKLAPGTDADEIVKEHRPQLDKLRLGHDTVADRKRELGQAMENLYHFLNLVGFVALLLGGVGVASAIHVHIKQKLGSVAVLRCLGGSVAQTFAIYLAQGMALGAFGAVAGAALGVGIQALLPRVLGDFIPFDFQFHTSWFAVGRAMATGFAICVMFAILPLLAVRRVSPLAAIRVSYEPQHGGRDPLRWLMGACLAAGILAFAVSQTRSWRIGLGFAGGLGLTFAVLAVIARLLIFATRRLVPHTLPFWLRQGIASLHRPNNRTQLLLLSLGLGTFLMASLYLVQHNLLSQLFSTGGQGQPNAVLFDIQPSQQEPLTKLIESLNLPVIDEMPIITMRLSSVNGRTVESLIADKGRRRPRWALRREYRCTYADHLRDGESIVAGSFVPSVTNGVETIPVSLEEGIAKELSVGVGDELVFDVQGVPVKTQVASLRKVEWRRIQPNFFVIFPRGSLDDAPAMHVMVTRVASADQSALMQREVVKAFPNVSVIDLTLVLKTIDSILGKISFVVRFMAMFTVATGLLVLVSALVTGRYQRIQESVLLRTLGASRGQILRILVVEYFSLGLLAALTGILLAVAAAWALAAFVFKMPFGVAVTPLLIALLVVPAITVITGLLVSRGVLNHPPLAILRAEAQ
jgi:putative ABC transport system permease protein